MQNQLQHHKLVADLRLVAEIAASHRLYDSHLHPVEIFQNLCQYHPSADKRTRYCLKTNPYRPPTLDAIARQISAKVGFERIAQRPAVHRMLMRQSYLNSGPAIFQDLAAFTHIRHGLLLPVAPRHADIDTQMAMIHKMFAKDDRFDLAGSIPNTISAAAMGNYLQRQRQRYQIIAVKLHPAVTGIDLNTARGRRRTQNIIAACETCHLPLIIHTGQSILTDGRRCDHALLAHFQKIRLGATIPIVLAHGGAFGLPAHVFEQHTLPILKRLMDRHPNLYIDIAGLDGTTIQRLISTTNPDRILFGSDGLYVNPVIMLLRLIDAIRRIGAPLDKTLVQILSQNADCVFFKAGDFDRIANKQMFAGF